MSDMMDPSLCTKCPPALSTQRRWRSMRSHRDVVGVSLGAPSAFFNGENSSSRMTSQTANALTVKDEIKMLSWIPKCPVVEFKKCKPFMMREEPSITYSENWKISKTNFSIFIPLTSLDRTCSPSSLQYEIFFFATWCWSVASFSLLFTQYKIQSKYGNTNISCLIFCDRLFNH